jgi:HTH-type transcriptional regulator/antitoxin MqsA
VTVSKEQAMGQGYYFTCGTCGEGKMKSVSGDYAAERDGTTHELHEVDFLQCERCGVLSFTPEQARQLQTRISAAESASKGLLTPKEIVELRSVLGGITQTDLEHLLNTGPKTVSRWERGTVCQSPGADQRMRIARAFAVGLPGISSASIRAVLDNLPSLIERLVASYPQLLASDNGTTQEETFSAKAPKRPARPLAQYEVTTVPIQSGMKGGTHAIGAAA